MAATAIVEVAEASGLGRVAEGERDAEAASTRGTGELIVAAVDTGRRSCWWRPAAARRPTAARARSRRSRRPAACMARGWSCCATCARRSRTRRAFRPPEGRRRGDRRRLSRRLDRSAASLAARPARRGDDRCRRRAGRRAVGGLRRRLEPGAPFVLDALGFDARMRAAAARSSSARAGSTSTTLEGKAPGEARDPRAPGRRPVLRDRRHQRTGPLRRPHPRPATRARGADPRGDRGRRGEPGGRPADAVIRTAGTVPPVRVGCAAWRSARGPSCICLDRGGGVPS